MVANTFKFIFGIFLAIAILVGSGVAAGLYLMKRTDIDPPKPIYSNDKPAVKAEAAKANPTVSASPNTSPKSSPSPTPTPTPTPTEKADELPPGAYTARVKWPQGLSIRTQPQTDAERAGGVAFEQEVVILGESDDGAWQKIRIPGSEQEGWVKAGNTERID